MTEFRCACCPYGYHLDTDFMKFLDDMYGPDVLRTLKKIERKRHDVRRRLINEQVNAIFVICLNMFNRINHLADMNINDIDRSVETLRTSYFNRMNEMNFMFVVLVCLIVQRSLFRQG